MILTQPKLYDPGIYHLRVQAIEEKTGTVTDKDTGKTKDSTYLRWTFEIMEEGFEGETIESNSGISLGPAAKARTWAEALINRSLHPNEPIDTDDLMGLQALATLTQVQKGNAKYNEIDALAPIRQKPVAPPQTRPQPPGSTPRVQLPGYPDDDLKDIAFGPDDN